MQSVNDIDLNSKEHKCYFNVSPNHNYMKTFILNFKPPVNKQISRYFITILVFFLNALMSVFYYAGEAFFSRYVYC